MFLCLFYELYLHTVPFYLYAQFCLILGNEFEERGRFTHWLPSANIRFHLDANKILIPFIFCPRSRGRPRIIWLLYISGTNSVTSTVIHMYAHLYIDHLKWQGTKNKCLLRWIMRADIIFLLVFTFSFH